MKHKKGAIACMANGGSIPAGASGFVPGTGNGDKIPAKYEPGEFIVSRAMMELDPKLGAHLSSLREMALAKQGMTPDQADAKAMMGGKLHAAQGYSDDGIPDTTKTKPSTLYPYNMPDKDIYAGIGKPSSAPENTPAPVRQQGVTGSWGAPDAAPASVPVRKPAAALAVPAMPAPAPVRPNPTGSSAMSGFMPGTRQAITDGGAEMRDSFGSGQYARGLGQAIGQIPRVANAIVTDTFGGFGSGVADLASGPGKSFARGALGMTPSASTTPTPTPAAAPAQPAPPFRDPRILGNPGTIAEQVAAGATAPEADATGKVKVTRQPNGIMEFSGKDITGDPQYTGTSGFNPGGFGVTNLGGKIAPSAESQATLTNPDGSRWTPQDSAIMAANMRDGIDPYRGTSRQAGQALTSFGQSGGFGLLDNEARDRRNAGVTADSITATKAQRAASERAVDAFDTRRLQSIKESGDTDRATITGATAARGQDITAASNAAQNKAVEQRIGMEGRRLALDTRKAEGEQAVQGFGLRSSQRMENVQKVLLNPNATPEERKLAKSTMAALGGKTAADRMQVVNLPDTETSTGLKIGGGQALIRTNEDGTVEQVPIGTQQAKAPQAAPAAGEIRNGFKFKGGNANDKANWEKV